MPRHPCRMATAAGALGALLFAACSTSIQREELVGAWRSRLQFASGAFASVKDLEFMYVFNTGGPASRT